MTKASGFLNGYSHTLNPYVGCAFGCEYCYVRQMPISLFHEGDWGEWVDIKDNAIDLLENEIINARKKEEKVSIFMSSSTDPYQPVEHKLELTRNILKILSLNQPDELFIQTRSPMVVRDIDIFKNFTCKILVSITIETDSDQIRKEFSPSAPPINARLNAVKKLKESSISVQVAVAPILPSTPEFAKKLKNVTDRVCIDDFFMGDGSGGKRTKRLGIEQKYINLEYEKWYQYDTIYKIKKRLLHYFSENQIYINKEGFSI